MKTILVLICFLYCGLYSVFSQEIKQLIPSRDITKFHSAPLYQPYYESLQTAKNGKITLADNTIIHFTRLKMADDSLQVFRNNFLLHTYSMNDIDMVTTQATKFSNGTLIGFCAGLGLGGIMSIIVNPQRSTLDWIANKINGEDNSHTITKEDLPYLVGGSVGGAAIGALIGLLTKTDKKIYVKDRPFISFESPYQPGSLLTLQINF